MHSFLPVFEALEKAGVRYVTVGGVAVILHGYPRLTADIDLVLDLEPSNVRKAIRALLDLGFKPRAPVDAMDFADPEKRRAWVEEKGLMVFTLYQAVAGPPVEVDLFAVAPRDFEDLWNHHEDRLAEGVTIAIVDKATLIDLKAEVGRPQDLEDISRLRS